MSAAPIIAATEPIGPADADLLVLGPSLGTSSLLWNRVSPMLAEHYRVVAWDLPGHGASPAIDRPFDVAELADEVVAIADRLGVERFWAAGISMGGATGLELGLRHGDRLHALAIVASGALLGAPGAWRDRAALVRSQSTSAVILPSAERWFAPGTAASDPDLTGRLLHVLQEADDESYARCCEALAAFDVIDRLGEIRTPLLALWGEVDVAAPEERSALIAERVPGARIARVDGAAHLPSVDRPVATATALLDFFGEVAAGRLAAGGTAAGETAEPVR